MGVYRALGKPELFDPVSFELGFRKLDLDNDGYISLQDILNVVKSCRDGSASDVPKWFRAYYASRK